MNSFHAFSHSCRIAGYMLAHFSANSSNRALAADSVGAV